MHNSVSTYLNLMLIMSILSTWSHVSIGFQRFRHCSVGVCTPTSLLPSGFAHDDRSGFATHNLLSSNNSQMQVYVIIPSSACLKVSIYNLSEV